MSDPFIGEIRMFGGNFAPSNWAFCDGSLLSIAEYEVLFELIGTSYGGDGQTTFALPDLRGRLPVHQGNGAGLSPRSLGETGGVEAVTLTIPNMPQHSHTMMASTNPGDLPGPANGVPAKPSNGATPYLYVVPGTSTVTPVAMGNSIQPAGASQPHTNLMPALCVNFIISLVGNYPSQN